MAAPPTAVSLLAANVLLELVILDATRVVCINHLEEGVDELALNRNLQLSDKVGHLVDGQVTALVQVKVVEDLLQELGVLAGEFPDASFDFAEQV